jgi:steroid delta-isomerase-like uncharacterized protein
MPTEPKALATLAERLVDAYNSRSLDDFDNVLTDDVVLVRDEEKAHGRAEFKAVLAHLRRAFPDIQYRIEQTVAVGDTIVLRWTARGTHQGEYLSVPATNRPVSYTGITIYEVKGDRVSRVWVSADLLSLLKRLRDGRLAEAPQVQA